MNKQLHFRRTGSTLLNPTEKKLLQLLSEGLTKARAAQELNVSRYTVDAHLREIFLKLEVHSTVAAVGKALRKSEIS